MIRALRLLPALLALLATSAMGQSENFVGFRAGYYGLAGGGDLEDMFQGLVEPSEFNGGTAGLFAVHYVTPNLAAQVSVDAFVPEVDFFLPSGDPDLPIPANASFGVFPVGLSARYRLWPDRFTPVGLAGLSLNPYRFDVSFAGFDEFGVEESGLRLGYHLGVGAELPFGIRWLFASELLYRNVDFSTTVLTSDGTSLEFEPDFSGFQLLVGFAYVF